MSTANEDSLSYVVADKMQDNEALGGYRARTGLVLLTFTWRSLHNIAKLRPDNCNPIDVREEASGWG